MRIALAAALLAASICPSPAAPAAHGLHACRLRNPLDLGSLPARCASFTVPEDRAVRGGARIRLHFAVVPALDRRRPAAPLFILAGGPGQSAIGLYAALAPAFAAIHRTHAIVLLDQRGTGASAPLNCATPEDFRTGAGALAQLRRATRACLAKYGDRVRFYTTSVAVRDLDELRRRLGYPQVDLYGASYGTRVAMQYMRRHPAAVHAAILDGVLDPTQAIGPSTPLDGERALRRIVARCERSRGCAAAFPRLPLELASLRRRFGSQIVAVRLDDPTSGTPLDVPFSRGVLAAALRFLSYSGGEASLLPLLIHEAAGGRLAPLAAQAVLTSRRIEGQLAIGMQNTVVCSEDVPYFHLGGIDRRRLAATYLGTDQLDALAAICKIWPRGPVDPDLHAPLVSDVPTLLLAGEDDPVTPPAAARAAAAGLSNHRLIVLAGEGHGQLATGCMPRLMARFLASGDPRRLDTSCLAAERPPPFFQSPAGPSP